MVFHHTEDSDSGTSGIRSSNRPVAINQNDERVRKNFRTEHKLSSLTLVPTHTRDVLLDRLKWGLPGILEGCVREDLMTEGSGTISLFVGGVLDLQGWFCQNVFSSSTGLERVAKTVDYSLSCDTKILNT